MSWFYIWDVFPILALVALIIAFVIRKRAMKKEEQELKEALESFTLKDRSNDSKQA